MLGLRQEDPLSQAFTFASSESVIAFLGICYAVVVFYLYAIFASERALGGNAGKRVAQFSFLLSLWLAILWFTVRSKVLFTHTIPAFPLLFLLMNGGALAFGLSGFGKRLALGTPIWAWVALQSFRLPLELVLHSWAGQGTIPHTMTWTGQNWDIVTGIVSLICAPFAVKSRLAAWVANVVGIALLANVARVAVMSSPLPFAWGQQPPLLLAMYFPYALIIPLCVGAALAGHVVLTRALLRQG